MRDVIKKVLAEWSLKLGQRGEKNAAFYEACSEMPYEHQDHLYNFERHLLGVTLFLAEVADQSNDMELLGMATKVKGMARDLIAAELREFQEFDNARLEEASEYDRHQAVAYEACRVFFASIPASVIDMSSYRQAVEGARPFFREPRDYLDLLSYTDERKVLKRIKKGVKDVIHTYVRNNNGESPAPEWMREKFDHALRNAYRCADQYVPAQIKRRAPQSLIPPISIDKNVT